MGLLLLRLHSRPLQRKVDKKDNLALFYYGIYFFLASRFFETQGIFFLSFLKSLPFQHNTENKILPRGLISEKLEQSGRIRPTVAEAKTWLEFGSRWCSLSCSLQCSLRQGREGRAVLHALSRLSVFRVRAGNILCCGHIRLLLPHLQKCLINLTQRKRR